MAKIVDIKGREVLDSRGNPTVEADVILDNGIVGSACAPSRCFHRFPRGPRAARWRQEPLPGQGRAESRGQHQRPDPRPAAGQGRGRPESPRPRDDRAGRHREQGQAGRQRDPRGVPGCRQGRRTGQGRTAVRAHRRPQRHPRPVLHAGADDEHHQRRRACGQQRRYPGIHGPAGRCEELRRGAAHGRRDLPSPQGRAEGPWPEHCRR